MAMGTRPAASMRLILDRVPDRRRLDAFDHPAGGRSQAETHPGHNKNHEM
jgi:hypothetical protein